jgi:uncharacterized protein (DUF1684 family)
VSLSLLQWRRTIAALYADIRAADDPADAHEQWRMVRDDLFARHPDSPIPIDVRSSFRGLDIAPYDPAFRFEVAVDTGAAPMRIEVATATDGVVPFDRIGVVTLDGVGTLDVWWLDSYGGGVFVPIKDSLAGRVTYGGGRYLLDTVKGADLGGVDGHLLLDLNFAYNPSCAYDPAWSCPLAQAGNTVAVPLPVGERGAGLFEAT